ncbi:MAG: TlpA family protein disulfide reductase [Alphaproteobacteria bacterium]|nr:TlpA family protein disulfide reductase [Alphaproteobacteria bacterium]
MISLLLALLAPLQAAEDLELALARFGAARDAGDLEGMRTQAAAALSADPEDWQAHRAWQQAQDRRPWWLEAEYAALAQDPDPELALIGEWYQAQRARRLPTAPPGVDPLLAAELRARSAIDLGQPEIALATLQAGVDPGATALRLEALWVEGQLRDLGKETKDALGQWPEHAELGAWAWVAEGVNARLARRRALEAAEQALAGEDLLALYRAHAVFVAAEEGEKAGAAAQRLAELGEPYPLGSRAPWTPSMVRDLGRILAVHRSPRPPAGGTPREDARVLAATARTLERQGRTERAAKVWRAAVEADGEEAHVLVRAAVGLDEAGAPPDEVLDLVTQARLALAAESAVGPELGGQVAAMAQLALVEARCHQRAGRMEQALVAAAEADALGAGGPALLLRAELSEALGHRDAAFLLYARAAAAGEEVPAETLERLYDGPASPEAVVEALAGVDEGPPGPRRPPRREAEAERFPADSLQTDQGEVPVGQGEILVVAFWASWCGPCAQELPALDALAQRLAQEGHPVRIVAISMDDEERHAGKWLSGHSLSLPVGWDPGLGRELGITALPTTWVIDGEGVVRQRHQGYLAGDDARLEEELRVILQGGPPAP